MPEKRKVQLLFTECCRNKGERIGDIDNIREWIKRRNTGARSGKVGLALAGDYGRGGRIWNERHGAPRGSEPALTGNKLRRCSFVVIGFFSTLKLPLYRRRQRHDSQRDFNEIWAPCSSD